MPVLKLLRGSSNTRQFPVSYKELTLGRDPKCDIFLKSDYVSVAHARFSYDGDRYYITDLASRNHTYLNGQRLKPEVAFPLEDSDLIKVCNFIFTFIESSSKRSSNTWTPVTGTSTASIPATVLEETADNGDANVSSAQETSSSNWNLQPAKNPEAKLLAMMQITRNLHNALSLEEMLDKVLDSLFAIFPHAESGAAVVRDAPDDEGLTIARRRDEPAPDDSLARRPIINNVMTTRRAIIMDSGTTSMACAPLLDVDDRAFGGIHLSSSVSKKRFSRDELDLLTHVALQTSFAIESIRLHEARRVDRERQIELEMAQRIQLGLMPSSTPVIDGYKFDDFYNPAKEVGGDFYDYIELADGRLAIVIGDVSGKGVPAALVVAHMSSMLKAYLAGDKTPLEVMNQCNGDFQHRIAEERFLTIALLVLDPATHEMSIVNAGHLPPLLRRANGEVEKIGLSESGLPFGVVEEFQYQESRLTLGRGDSLTICTDGITEAGEARDMYGTERLVEQIAKEAGDAAQLRDRIMEDVLSFVGQRPQHDDMCLLCISRD